MRGSQNDIPITFEKAGVVIQGAVWDDIHVSFETFEHGFDNAPLLRGLPNDCCPCPHWGYVLAGQIRVIYKDREEVLQAGDAYYIQPGHTAIYEPGTQMVEFSPNDQFQAAMSEIARIRERRDGT